jgi:hypothetical protein
LRAQGVTIQWNTELVALAQGTERVRATLQRADGTSQVLAVAWTAGCDGAHSAVRDLNGIAFEGAPYQHVFFVADTELTGPMVPDEINIYLWRDGFHLFFPLRGTDHWRIAGILPENMRDRKDLTLDDVAPAVRHEAGDQLDFKSCSWFSTYRIHHRRAVRFREGRYFLLGDAAHIHSPVGAQGMNTGLQDAYNLAWKLALVVSGRADAQLLDSYAEERMPVARKLLNTTDRAFSIIVSNAWYARWIRARVVARAAAVLMARKWFQRLAFTTVSQIGIHYAESPLSETHPDVPKDAPQAGDRFPWLQLAFASGDNSIDLFRRLDDTHFHLIVVGQPAPAPTGMDLGDLLEIHAVRDDSVNRGELLRGGIPSPSFYLLRPDGHIGLAGVRMDPRAVAGYVAERLHMGTLHTPSHTGGHA